MKLKLRIKMAMFNIIFIISFIAFIISIPVAFTEPSLWNIIMVILPIMACIGSYRISMNLGQELLNWDYRR